MADEGKSDSEKSSDLARSVFRYFKKEGYAVDAKDTSIEGTSGITSSFDLIVHRGRISQGVWVRDWNRTIGINMVINIDKASEDVKLSNPIIVGEKFSDHAKSYANRRKITLLTKSQIAKSLR